MVMVFLQQSCFLDTSPGVDDFSFYLFDSLRCAERLIVS